MYICGTVRWPVFSIISRRRSGSRSTRIFSMSVAPLRRSNCSARTQYGQTAVAYIVILAMTDSGLLGQRQAGIGPGVDAAGEIEHLLEAGLFQFFNGGLGARTHRAADDDGRLLELVDLAEVLIE